VIVGHYGIAVDVRLDASGERISLRVRRDSGHVVGERVAIVPGGLRSTDDDRGVLRRRDPRGRRRAVAANLDLLGIVVAPRPETPLGFVDRACVGALAAGIEPVIVVNKCDQPGADATLESFRASHGAALRVLPVSARDGTGLDLLAALFAPDRRGAFVGTSGVGKSSLANALCPALALDTGEINEQSGLGRHVTTNATLHALPGGGELVDTPGFRDFGPVEVSALELSQGFIGFRGVVDEACRFRDCRHLKEPGCAVRAALEEGRLRADRYRVYCSLLEEIEALERGARPR
jgi:ribosome biogenesis GTPase